MVEVKRELTALYKRYKSDVAIVEKEMMGQIVSEVL